MRGKDFRVHLRAAAVLCLRTTQLRGSYSIWYVQRPTVALTRVMADRLSGFAVESNDRLYGGDENYTNQLLGFIDNLMTEILAQLTAIGEPGDAVVHY